MRLGVVAVMLSLVSCGNSSSITEPTDGGFSIDTTQIDPSGQDEDVLSEIEAGRLYLEIVNPVNCVSIAINDLEIANSLGDGTVDPTILPEMMDLFAQIGEVRETAVRDLLNFVWPETVAPDIDLLARQWSKFARAEAGISMSADLGTYNIAMSNYLELLKNSDANPGYIRSALGIGPANETDQC